MLLGVEGRGIGMCELSGIDEREEAKTIDL